MKRKDHLIFVLTMIVSIAFVVSFIFWTFSSFYSTNKESISALAKNEVREHSEKIDKYFSNAMIVMEATAAFTNQLLEEQTSHKQLLKILKDITKYYQAAIDTNFTGVYGLLRGKYLDGLGWEPGKDFKPKERDWYIAAKNEGEKIAFVPPYLDARTQTIMMSIAYLLHDTNSVISVDLAFNKIQELTSDFNLSGIALGFILYENGLIVAHTVKTEVGKNFLQDSVTKPLTERIIADEGVFEITLNGNPCTIFSEEIQKGWYSVLVVPNYALYQNIENILLKEILIGVLILIVILIFVLLIYHRLSRSIKSERISIQKLSTINDSITNCLAKTIDAKDRYTKGHSARVAYYAKLIAQKAGKSSEEQELIYSAGLMHDIGKIRVLEDIINKSGKLTPDEFAQIKLHPVTGYHILKNVKSINSAIALAAKFHHERYDGTGYPNGLVGTNIPEIARIIGVADAYDAMTSNRSYRKTLSQKYVREEIERGIGTQFDPHFARIMLTLIDEDQNYEMCEAHSLKKFILICDKSARYIDSVVQIMSDEENYEILTALTGEDALELLKKVPVDLLLLDTHMPDMDGYETYQRLRDFSDVPVIFTTDNKDIETIQKTEELEVEDFLMKPFSPLIFKEVVLSVFNS